MPQGTIERKIYFYRANAGINADGSDVQFNIVPALHHINTLGFVDRERYLVDDDRVLCCWVDQVAPQPRLRLGSIRRNGLPQVERHGDLKDLNIPSDSGLLEAIHIVGFPGNIFAADFNYYGPRMSQLSNYLTQRAPEMPAVSFEALINPDVLTQLNQLANVKLFQLKIRAPFASHVKEASKDLGSAFPLCQDSCRVAHRTIAPC